jgi:hypothetical protein
LAESRDFTSPGSIHTHVSCQAIWSYTPREVSKVLLRVLSFIAVANATKRLGRGALKAIPFIGVGIGAGMNKALTMRVGNGAHRALAARLRAVQGTVSQ